MNTEQNDPYLGILDTVTDAYRVMNDAIQSIGRQLEAAAVDVGNLQRRVAELERRVVTATRMERPADDSGYSPSDPKHPAWHSVHADIWDNREKGA
jgi:hypothetical protein